MVVRQLTVVLVFVLAAVPGFFSRLRQGDSDQQLPELAVFVNLELSRGQTPEEDAIEQRLEERGIPLGNSRSAADLYVNVATVRGSTCLYAYCVRVSVQQLVTIEGNQLRAFVDTWDRASVGAVGEGNLPELQTVVMQIVDRFSDDYLDMNDLR